MAHAHLGVHDSHCTDPGWQVWSADAKPLEEFCGVSDDVAHVAYVPFTHSYWQVCRSGRINAYDARAPAKVTELVEDCNTLMDEVVDRLWVPPHSDSMFASTEDRKIIQYRCTMLNLDFHRTNQVKGRIFCEHLGLHLEPLERLLAARWRSDGLGHT